MKAIVGRALSPVLHPYSRAARRIARAWLRRMDYAVDRRVLSQEEFVRQLRTLGITSGATIYLHTSMDELSRRVPGQNAPTLVNLLMQLLGEEGTLLAPTFPFRGLQYRYVQRQRVFDVNRTPSHVGLFTEVFRRTAGVTRSLHPTHPVAAWGKYGKELVAEHHLGTAFGEKSPVYKMQQYHGLVVGIGVIPKRCFTLYHVAEELHPSTHAIQYSTDSFEMIIIHGREKIPYRVIPSRPERIRQYGRADRILRREGILRYYTIKGLKLSVTPVRQFLQRAHELIDTNKFYSKRP
jgi:aminoglycoside N3'-acetyltransferase